MYENFVICCSPHFHHHQACCVCVNVHAHAHTSSRKLKGLVDGCTLENDLSFTYVSTSFQKGKGPQRSTREAWWESQCELSSTGTRVWLLMLSGVVVGSFGHGAQPSILGLWERDQRVTASSDSALGFLLPGWLPRRKQALLPAPTATATAGLVTVVDCAFSSCRPK